MKNFPKTIVVRHRKENLKKCSLRGLESRSDFEFCSYPMASFPKIEAKYILLSLNAVELSKDDSDCGLFILDATWRYAQVMEKNIQFPPNVIARSLPNALQTAYPRKQEDCQFPGRGLASIEAIAAAYAILGRDLKGLLDHYYWKELFLERNRTLSLFTEI